MPAHLCTLWEVEQGEGREADMVGEREKGGGEVRKMKMLGEDDAAAMEGEERQVVVEGGEEEEGGEGEREEGNELGRVGVRVGSWLAGLQRRGCW